MEGGERGVDGRGEAMDIGCRTLEGLQVEGLVEFESREWGVGNEEGNERGN